MVCVHCVIHSKRTTTPNPRNCRTPMRGLAAGSGSRGALVQRVWVVGCVVLMVVSVVIAEGKRPVSFRTRKLSPPAPMVLHSGGGGGVGHRRTQRNQARGAPTRGRPSPVFAGLNVKQ